MQWISTNEQLPPEGLVVDTKIDDERGCRNEQPLKWRGNLWYVADGSMYVYYRPTHWKPEPPEQTRKRLDERIAKAEKELESAKAEAGQL